jgi:hypothetical protein
MSRESHAIPDAALKALRERFDELNREIKAFQSALAIVAAKLREFDEAPAFVSLTDSILEDRPESEYEAPAPGAPILFYCGEVRVPDGDGKCPHCGSLADRVAVKEQRENALRARFTTCHCGHLKGQHSPSGTCRNASCFCRDFSPLAS